MARPGFTFTSLFNHTRRKKESRKRQGKKKVNKKEEMKTRDNERCEGEE
jgi:hypothetical protein